MKIKNIAITSLCVALAIAGCKPRKDYRKEYYMLGDFDKYSGMVIREIERDYASKTDRELGREYRKLPRSVSYNEAKKLDGLGRKVYFCDSHLPD